MLAWHPSQAGAQPLVRTNTAPYTPVSNTAGGAETDGDGEDVKSSSSARNVAFEKKEGCQFWEKFVLVPDRGSRTFKWLRVWDILTSIIVVACAYVVPFSLALPTVAPQNSQCFNRAVDLFFTVDMCLHFFTAYRLPREGHSDKTWEKDPCKIALRYFKFGFWLDLFSVAPGWIDCIAGRGQQWGIVLRCFRMLRMSRLSKVQSELEEMQARAGLPFVASDVIQFVFISTFACHVAACVWVMIEAKQTSKNYFVQTFLSDVDKSWLTALIDGKDDSCKPDAAHNDLCVYNLALYWAMMTLTTVGYGDITPQNTVEYAVCTLYMLAAGFIWAYIVASVVSLLSQVGAENSQFKQHMDDLNAFMEHRSMPGDLRIKLREYMLYAKGMGQARKERSLLDRCISNSLQREVVLTTPLTSIIIQKVYWASGLEQDALLEIMRCLLPETYGKEETIPMKDRMFVIREGLVASRGRIYSRNEVFGAKSILLHKDSYVANAFMPRTLSFVHIMVLTRKALCEACCLYPSADKRLRRAQVRAAVWRGFVIAASKETQSKEKEPLSPKTTMVRASSKRLGVGVKHPEASFADSSNTDQGHFLTPTDLSQVQDKILQSQQELKDLLSTLNTELAAQRASRSKSKS